MGERDMGSSPCPHALMPLMPLCPHAPHAPDGMLDAPTMRVASVDSSAAGAAGATRPASWAAKMRARASDVASGAGGVAGSPAFDSPTRISTVMTPAQLLPD